jgi:hypothetical protein
MRFDGHPPVVVLPHAIERMQLRGRDTRASSAVAQGIAGEVRLAILEHRVANHKPKAFRLYRETKGRSRLLPHQRCVWDSDEKTAWIVSREKSGEITVITTLMRSLI